MAIRRELSDRKHQLFWKILVFGSLLFFAIAVNQRMIREGLIFESNDLKYHILWLQHFSKQFTEGILYPRWLSGDNYGYGSPTFVFYPPLVYYLGTALKLIGLDIVTTLTALFVLATFFAGLNFYIYGNHFWGKLPSLAGALFYMTTPYIAFNIYSRGALAEVWAMIWIPLGLWLIHRSLDSDRSKWKISLTIVAATLALTHVPSLLIFTLSCFIYLIVLATRHSWKKIILVAIHVLMGFGLVSFYLLPAILEKSLVNIDFMRFDDGYKRNLISFGLVAANKSLSKVIEPLFLYHIGIIILLLIAIFLVRDRYQKTFKAYQSWLIYLILVAFLCIYPSLPIWQLSSTLQMVQFPWRLFGIFSFGIAGLFALTINQLKTNKSLPKKVILIATIVLIISANTIYGYKISLKLAGFNNPGNIAAAKAKGSWKASIYEQIKVAIENPYDDILKGTNEYRPLLQNNSPSPAPQIGQPKVSLIQGNAQIKIQKWHSYHRSLQIIAKNDSLIKLRTYFYPAWQLSLNSKPHKIDMAEDGTILATIPPGNHHLELHYQPTLVFKIGLILSFFSLITLIIFNILLSKYNLIAKTK